MAMGVDESREEDALPQILNDRGGILADEIIPHAYGKNLTVTDRHSPVLDRRPDHRHNGPGTEQSGGFGMRHGKVLTRILQRNHDNRSAAFSKSESGGRVKNLKR
jgi:hypothetical protein